MVYGSVSLHFYIHVPLKHKNKIRVTLSEPLCYVSFIANRRVNLKLLKILRLLTYPELGTAGLWQYTYSIVAVVEICNVKNISSKSRWEYTFYRSIYHFDQD